MTDRTTDATEEPGRALRENCVRLIPPILVTTVLLRLLGLDLDKGLASAAGALTLCALLAVGWLWVLERVRQRPVGR